MGIGARNEEGKDNILLIGVAVGGRVLVKGSLGELLRVVQGFGEEFVGIVEEDGRVSVALGEVLRKAFDARVELGDVGFFE